MNPTADAVNAQELIALVGGIVCIIIATALESDDREKIRRNRGRFWGAGCAFSSFMFVGMLPDWKYGIEAAVACGILFASMAFAYTPFLKVRGRIYAAQWRHRQAESVEDDSGPDRDRIPDSYTGFSPAAQSWWMLTVVCLVCLIVIYADFVAHNNHVHLFGIPATIVVVYVPLYVGYWDASWNYPVARGQLNQFTMLSIMTAGIFAALYFATFHIGKRWPWRPKRSIEYRMHPRHRRQGGED
ncbi:hypothetical protein [[Mycobacterium] vasticus]|uniref:Uncharacterized protein n=1 Tax=[Mycobacterium] vasticus TaxID=2875777 RepID=A0ABU5YW32_9MYCO|nr:hypothetical protein [Mycolicibacter sp. MYC017]MEB3069325.1 hypothetical protein [Mycolicibacter sp. MYC017]